MITTEGGETKVAEAVRLGAAGYVRKPFTADQIKEKLSGFWSRPSYAYEPSRTHNSLHPASAGEVFSTMLGADIGTGEVTIEDHPSVEPNDGVVSFIGIAGSWAGTGSLTCSPPMACRICSAMLMTEGTAVDEEVLDAVAELTNMIIGSVKTDLENELGPLGLSIPTVVFGRNFKTKSAGTGRVDPRPFPLGR